MSKQQLETLWVQAGGSPSKANIAAAIALAESSGNPNSTDYDSNGTVDRGLWQINSIHGTQSTYGTLANAQAAVAISNDGSDWTPWVTYNSGAYKQFLGGASAIASTSTSTSSVASTGSSSSSSSSLSQTLLEYGEKASLYVALIGAGIVLVWLGTKEGLKPEAAKA